MCTVRELGLESVYVVWNCSSTTVPLHAPSPPCGYCMRRSMYPSITINATSNPWPEHQDLRAKQQLFNDLPSGGGPTSPSVVSPGADHHTHGLATVLGHKLSLTLRVCVCVCDDISQWLPAAGYSSGILKVRAQGTAFSRPKRSCCIIVSDRVNPSLCLCSSSPE